MRWGQYGHMTPMSGFYLLSGVSFKNIGWLCDVRQAESINYAVALDVLHKELIEYYSLSDDTAT